MASQLANAGVVLRAEEFRLLRDLFSAKTGLNFGSDARFTLERRLRERLAVLNLTSFAEYYHYLKFSPRADAEWDEAVDLVTTNETYFFREAQQLRAFREEVLPLMAEQAKGRRRLTVWSAGSSSGEEAYTLAILIHASGLFPRAKPGTPGGWDVRIYGSDLSKKCITSARRAIYPASAFRTTPDDIRREYFTLQPEGARVVDHIRELCHFGQLNLMDEERARLLGRIDVIFCRNVLIYFDAHSRRKVIDNFNQRLYPGGLLLLGHSESLLNVSTAFELLHLKEDLVYRKPSRPAKDGSGSQKPVA